MKTVEMGAAQRDLAGICQAVAATGQAVVVTEGSSPLVSIVPVPQTERVDEGSIWELRREFEQRHGPLTEDFDLPCRHVDEERWEDPLKTPVGSAPHLP